jgi:aerobic-type carbon monoxide dehydrogenase small subunit (CoxS/CutS family)
MEIVLNVNGAARTAEVEARRTLSDCLRHDLGLTGTHVGCAHGVCGACTVLMDGVPVRACLMLAVQAEGHELTTVEGLSDDEVLSPLQAAFRRHGALQCGYCTPGFLTVATAILQHEPAADVARVRDLLSGNLCRCTGYIPIVEAVMDALAEQRLTRSAA